MIDNIDVLKDRADVFKQLVDQQSQVASTSFCMRAPPAIRWSWLLPHRYDAKEYVRTDLPVDDSYISTLGIHLADGRNFSKNLLSDTNS